MTTTWGNIATVLIATAGFLLFGMLPLLLTTTGGWSALSSSKFVISCAIAGLVFGVMVIEDQNPSLLRLSPWLRILAGGTCGAVIAIIWDGSLLTLITASAVGTVFGFFSRWLDF